MDDDWIDMSLKAPFLMNISGCSGAGKSTLIKEIIKNRHTLINGDIKNVYYVYNIDTLELHQIRLEHPEVFFSPTVPNIDLTDCLLILEDFQQEIEQNLNTFITGLAIKGRSHKNLSVIITTHNLYARNMRTFNLNCNYLVLFKFPRDSSVIQTLGKQVFPGKPQFVTSAYEFCMNLRKHGYMVFDFTPTQNDRFRVRSSLFADSYAYALTPTY